MNWSGRVRDCVQKYAAARGSFAAKALRSLLRPFLDPSSALSVALGSAGWILIQFGTSTCVEYMVWFEHRVYFCTNTKSVPDSLHACIKKLGGGQRTRLTRNCCRQCGPRNGDFEFDIRVTAQATNATARAELCYSRSRG